MRLGVAIAGLVSALIMIGGVPVASAETGQKALILDSSVIGGASSLEATNAIGNGFTVNVVDDATWGATTAAQFADYQLIIVGDPSCGSLPQVVSQNATALADAVMARAGGNTKAGNRVLIGSDPVFHSSQGGDKLIESAIDFAGVQDGATNLYLDFTCGDPDYDLNGTPDGQDKLLPLLTLDPTPGWTQNSNPPCGGSVSLISNAAQFATLTSANLQGWSCSDHETFPTFPTDWTALAIATDTPTSPTCGTDVDTRATVCGEAYVLIAGSGIVVAAPNLSLDPATATNPVGTSHTVTATVTNPNGSPRSGVDVSFVVTGANAGASGTCGTVGCTTDLAGKTTFTYTGANLGTDTINAAITVDGSRQTATASKTWVAPTADTTAPDTTITSGPSGTTTDKSPSFGFTSSEPTGATFQCKLDGPGATTGSYGDCTPSPKAYSNLADGTYTFSVKAKDAAGNEDATPATRSFTVDTTPPPDTTAPDTTITSDPSGTTTDKSPSFEFTSNEIGTFECRVDGGAFASCSSAYTATALSDGQHTFEVRATDAAGNVDPTPASRTFTLSTGPSGPTCDGKAATIIGTLGKDKIKGTPGADVIVSLGGNDKISGRGGDDVICAGAGKDRVRGGTGADTVFGGSGKDSISGDSGNDQLEGEAGNDKLKGGRGSDTLLGGPGNDRLNGGPGHDGCAGGPGKNTLISCET